MAKLIQRFAQHESEVDPEYAEQWRKNTSGRMGDVKMADQYAYGGEVKCAHCGSVEFVPLKAMGGEVGGPLHGDMKELYPSKKDAGAHLDDGKIRSFGKMFVHAIKHRRG